MRHGSSLKGNEAVRVEVSKFGYLGLKKILDPECVDGNAVILVSIPAKTGQKLDLNPAKTQLELGFCVVVRRSLRAINENHQTGSAPRCVLSA